MTLDEQKTTNGGKSEAEKNCFPLFGVVANLEVFDLKNVFTKDEAEIKSYLGSTSKLTYNVCIIN